MKLEDKIMKAFDDGINDQKYLYQVKRDVSDIFKLHKYKKIEKKELVKYTTPAAWKHFIYDGCGEAIRCDHKELEKTYSHEQNSLGFVTKTITGYQCKECNNILYTQ